MARPRAADHDDKRLAILERSAALFAAHGYDRASLGMIAEACGVSKALLYHYYADKSQLLFDIVRGHLEMLLDVTREAEERAGPPRERLVALAQALLEAYRSSDAYHHVQINQMRLLPPERQDVIRDLERQLVARFARALRPCVPAAAEGLLKPLTMSLFGMLNWHYLWFREDGPMRRAEYARLAVTLVIDGAAGYVPNKP